MRKIIALTLCLVFLFAGFVGSAIAVDYNEVVDVELVGEGRMIDMKGCKGNMTQQEVIHVYVVMVDGTKEKTNIAAILCPDCGNYTVVRAGPQGFTPLGNYESLEQIRSELMKGVLDARKNI